MDSLFEIDTFKSDVDYFNTEKNKGGTVKIALLRK